MDGRPVLTIVAGDIVYATGPFASLAPRAPPRDQTGLVASRSLRRLSGTMKHSAIDALGERTSASSAAKHQPCCSCDVQAAVIPPSITCSMPVMKDDSSEARKRARYETSDASAIRPSGICAAAPPPSASVAWTIIGVVM